MCLLAALLSGVALLGLGLRALCQDASPGAQARIVALFQEARAAEQRREFAEAVKLYDEILRLDPKIAEVWTNKGLVLYELNRDREALAAFAKAAALKPRLLTPQLFLGIIHLKRDEPAKAVGPLQAALALEPHHPQATYELANARARLGQFESATKLYRDLVARDPKMEQAWYRLGIAYLNWSKAAARKLVDSPGPTLYGKLVLAELQAVGGILLDAEANYRAAVEAFPNSAEARTALGRFYLDFQPTPERIQAAQEQLARAKLLDARDPQVEIALVRLAVVQGNSSEALTHLKNVLEADLAFARKRLPECLAGLPPDALHKMVASASALQAAAARDSALASATPALLYSAYLELGDIEQAERNLRAFEGLAGNLARAPGRGGLRSYSRRLKQLGEAQRSRALSRAERIELAECAWNVGAYDRALRFLLEVLKKSANDRALYWLSLTCRALARETFQKAIDTNPDSYRAHLLLADLANDHHDTGKARAEYEKAVALGAGDPEVHLLFVQFLRSKGWDQEALGKARAAVERFPTHPALNCELGQLLIRMKRPEEAAPYFKRSLAADPTLATAHAGLADSYAAAGEIEKAIQEMKQALAADADGSYHYRLGRWYQKNGQTHEAAEAFAVSTKLKKEKLKKDTERFLMPKRGD